MSLHLEKFCGKETIGQSIRRENEISVILVVSYRRARGIIPVNKT